jgi:hypothetical protein
MFARFIFEPALVDFLSTSEYQRMADALATLSKTSGKPPFVFSLCEWGQEQVWL